MRFFAFIVAFIWTFVMFALVRWIAKELRRPDQPVVVVALAAYVLNLLFLVLGNHWSRRGDPTAWGMVAAVYAGPTVLVAVIDVLMQRRRAMNVGKRNEHQVVESSTDS